MLAAGSKGFAGIFAGLLPAVPESTEACGGGGDDNPIITSVAAPEKDDGGAGGGVLVEAPPC